MESIDPKLSIGSKTRNFSMRKDSYPLFPLLIEVCFIFFRFLGFWCCLNAFSISTNIKFLEWISGFSFAWTIGLVVPGAPGGLGVFETAMLLRFSGLVPEAKLVAVLLFYRIVATIADVFAATFLFRKDSIRSDFSS